MSEGRISGTQAMINFLRIMRDPGVSSASESDLMLIATLHRQCMELQKLLAKLAPALAKQGMTLK